MAKEKKKSTTHFNPSPSLFVQGLTASRAQISELLTVQRSSYTLTEYLAFHTAHTEIKTICQPIGLTITIMSK